MKTLTKISLLAVGLAVAAVSALTAAATVDHAAAGSRHPRLRALMQRRAAVRAHLARRLGLTADQISQLKASRQQTVAAIKAIRADASLTADQKKARARETLEAARSQMRGVLSADQQAQLDQMRKHFRKGLLGKG